MQDTVTKRHQNDRAVRMQDGVPLLRFTCRYGSWYPPDWQGSKAFSTYGFCIYICGALAVILNPQREVRQYHAYLGWAYSGA